MSDFPEAEPVCKIAHFAGAQAAARSGGAIICDAAGRGDKTFMPDPMGSIPGHLSDVANSHAGTGARSRSQQHLLVKASPAAEKSWMTQL